MARQRTQDTVAKITEPQGRAVVIDRDRWQHIIEQHPEMAHHLAEIMATVGTPEHDGPDPRPHRHRLLAPRSRP